MAGQQTIRFGIAQMNSTVGAFEKNALKIIEYTDRAKKSGCDIVIFPELALCGYPPEDLIYKSSFVEANTRYIQKIASQTSDIVSIVGFVEADNDIFNAAAIIADTRIQAVYRKMLLPNYSVFDEARYFSQGSKPLIVELKDRIMCGITICEDIWHPEGPGAATASAGAHVTVSINASPFHARKWVEREKMLSARAAEYGTAVLYCNLVGGQDELVFDGHSLAMNTLGHVIARADSFEEQLLICDIPPPDTVHQKVSGRNVPSPLPAPEKIVIDRAPGIEKPSLTPHYATPPSFDEEIYKALQLGLRDYFQKNNFRRGVIGLSGGIDSALVAVIASEALGKENVTGVFMPSPYTSQESREDAYQLAQNLGIEILEVPITNIFDVYRNELKPAFKNAPADITEENLQARIRGNILMALSNKFGWLVLTTGNKSEMSTGYATLYGDMAGGFALLKDVPKTVVYSLSRYYNTLRKRNIIPESVLTKAPTAELKPDQKDQDTLPPYDILDAIIKAYVEEDRSKQEIIAMGIDEDIVNRTVSMIDRNEYKRRQAPPGVKITPRAFGKDRRMPITNNFKE